MQSILKYALVFVIRNISCDLLFLKTIFKKQATLRQILPVDENEAHIEVQKDKKHYNMLQKQKCLAKKLQLNKVNANNKLIEQ